ncbi:ribonuclease HII domain protein [[Clostridium] sordellii ATCC 9714]|nr:ribonuclease HII domain protein [[Clostridium] sordellii ATCC 9714] [Paeniclostridium sordellii ATCC 9714]
MKEKSVKEINSIIENISTDEYLKYIDILKDDERKSVKNIAVKLAKKLDKMRAENERLEMINIFENEGYEKGFTYIGE